jgi:signal transduction histidine kinase
MTDVIRAILDGYDTPVFLSDANQGTILFTNRAVEHTLGFSNQHLAGTPLDDLLKDTRVIQKQPVYEHNNDQYLVQNDQLTLSGNDYIKSVLKPFHQETVLSHLDFQKEMAGRLVHLLHSPLNGVSGFTELLKSTELSKKQLGYIYEIEDGLKGVASVLSDVQSLAEPVSPDKNEVNFSRLAGQAAESLTKAEQERLGIIIEAGTTPIETDFALLKAIVEELLLNAVQHGPDDGSPITLHINNNRIRVTTKSEPIPESMAANVFHPFFSRKARHTGIGLAKCTACAHHLDMELELSENSKAEGVSFDIVF